MKDMIVHAIMYSVILLLACPLAGMLLDFVTDKFFNTLLGIFDRSGALYLAFMNVLTFPGVIHHELSHALIAFILGAKIKKINLYKISNGSLGSVTYVPRGPVMLQSLQRSLSSAAPVFMGIITECILIPFAVSAHIHPFLLFLLIYLIISIVIHMDMSITDIIVYVKGTPLCFCFLFILFMVLFHFEIIPVRLF